MAAQHAAGGAIPIVMNVGDAIGTGLVSSLARPAGNITDVSDLTAELSAKRLDSLREMVPGLSRLAVLWTAANPGASLAFEETARAARGLGLDVQPLPVRAPEELERVLQGASLLATAGGALVVVQDPLTLTYRRQIVDLVTEIRLPAIYGFREFVDVGGLMSYAADLRDIYRTLATLVDRILRGTQASDLPVEQPTKFELIVNLKAAKAIGLTVPPKLLARADEVIE
jgi:putative ABC transport system substrate-binding protein